MGTFSSLTDEHCNMTTYEDCEVFSENGPTPQTGRTRVHSRFRAPVRVPERDQTVTSRRVGGLGGTVPVTTRV